MSSADIHLQLLEVDGMDVTSRQLADKWQRTFAPARDNVTDINRSG
jgi:hypothetical protein